jgi:hypothetical protein
LLASITPLGERSRGSRFSVTFISFALGCVVAGGALGLVLGLVGTWTHIAEIPNRLYIFAAFAAIGALADLRVVQPIRTPTHRRQVPDRWLYTYRGWVYGAGFGLQLGLAFATVINSSLVYLMALAAILVGSPEAAAVIGAAFGCARAAALVPAMRVRTPSELMRMTRLLDELDERAQRLVTAAAGALAVAVLLAGIY